MFPESFWQAHQVFRLLRGPHTEIGTTSSQHDQRHLVWKDFVTSRLLPFGSTVVEYPPHTHTHTLDKGLPSLFPMKEAESHRKSYQPSRVTFKRESGDTRLNRQAMTVALTLGTGLWKPCMPGWSPETHTRPCSTEPTAKSRGPLGSPFHTAGMKELSKRKEKHLTTTQGGSLGKKCSRQQHVCSPADIQREKRCR